MRALRPLVVGTWLFSATLAAQDHTHHAMNAAAHGEPAAALQTDGTAGAPAAQDSQAATAAAPASPQATMPAMTPVHGQHPGGTQAVPETSGIPANDAAAPSAAPPATGPAHPRHQHSQPIGQNAVAPMDHSQMSHAGMDHGAMHHAGMDHGAMEAMGHDSADQAAANPQALEHGAATQGSMKSEVHHEVTDHRATQPAPMTHHMMQHGSSAHDGMQHHSMDHHAHAAPTPASPVGMVLPREPIPAPTAEEIAAAFAPLQAHTMHGAGINHYVLLDRLEAVDTDRGTGQDWEARAWIGGDIDRLWLRSEGERDSGRTRSASLEAFYGHAISPWWDLLVGARQDLAPGDRRSWAAVGLQGLAPYKFETEATLYLGSAGRAALRLEGEYDILLTNRLILQPRVEADIALTDDDRRGISSGLEQVEAGLRLRYEFTRRFAPYIGWVHTRSFGDAARRAALEGERPREGQFVAGIRLWF
ncbi:copper resistance protein B [Xanthomonas sp. NCPPB 3582]|uniref:copper resistance protein B n=1 Tax=Xanthomonas sp. NCPPB 3582 TaxID=487557 RepID=UPI00355881A3